MRKTVFCALIAIDAWAGECAQPDPQGTATSVGYTESAVSSSFLKARFYLPDSQKGYYRGTRFDWSGLISRVDYQGHTFFSEFKETHDPLNHDDICGTAEEFGITSPPSYDQAGPGKTFIKIGIGVLKRPDGSEYSFSARYPIEKPGDWTIERRPDRVTFKQTLHGPAGWAYQFTKTIEARNDAPVLKITRRLKNTGTELIDTQHYGHNFLRIDNDSALTDYSLEFPFAPRFAQDSKTEGCVEIKERSLVFTKQTTSTQAIWVRLEGFEKREDNEIKIVNQRTRATMTISTDQPLSRLVFYSSAGVLCPEPFIKVNLPPGQTQEWTTTYRFEAHNR